MSLLKETIEDIPLNLVSTPIAIMARHGLRTYAGVTADDPSSKRNTGVNFVVILSIYGEGLLLGRINVGTVFAHEHYFIDIDAEVARYKWSDTASLCVVHRVPTSHISKNRKSDNIGSHKHADFSMYRTVVQYALEGSGMGSVIYETPPNFNVIGSKPHFLSFSNKIYLHPDTQNHLCLLNYSISANYAQAADVKIEFRNASGNCIGCEKVTVAAFDFECVIIEKYIQASTSTIVSYSAASLTSALLPLSIITNKRSGSVSVEHSHPPQEYMMSDWSVINRIKRHAAKSIFEGKYA